jgi:processive 1,2-diacylglycerol beta-glucosyltransferase
VTAAANKPLRCMVLNVDVGAGHRLAALALQQAIEVLRPGSRFEVLEALDYLGPNAKQIARDLYLGVQESTPDLWGLIYKQRSLLKLFRPLSELVDDFRAEELLPRALRFNPALLIATHPVACGLGAGLRRGGEIVAPLVAVVTDYDGHPAWVVKGVDLYLAPTPEVARQLEQSGAPAGAVAATGIPLRGAFSALPDAAEARRRIGVDPRRLTLLLLGGGLGLGPVLQTAEALASLAGPLQLVLIAGNNDELRRGAEALAARSPGAPLHVRGYVDNMVDYIAAADVAVSKPGGVTCAELLAVGVPLIALRPLAGQEEANCAALVQRGAAVRADDAEEAHAALTKLLHHPGELANMRQAALRMGAASSGRAGARAVLGLLGGG